MRIKSLLVLFFLFITSFLSFSEIIIPSEAKQGDLVPIYYSTKDLTHNFSIELGSIKVKGFLYSKYKRKNLWIAFLAIPMDFEPGEYNLRVFVNSKTDKTAKNVFEIIPGDFISEVIPLNKKMSSLNKNNTIQRQVDRNELKVLLSIFNNNAVYKTNKFDFPLIGKRFSSFFGDKRIYKYNDGSISRSRHHGLDIAAPTGSIVKAGAVGKVVLAKERVISGNTVVLEYYPGFYGLYYHLDSLSVKKGQVVSSNTVIGTVGSTGLVTGPHLHWQIVVNNIAVNPEKLVAFQLIDKDKINSIID